MIPCRDCPHRYIGQTSRKIETRITEHKNAIKRHDHLSYLQLDRNPTTWTKSRDYKEGPLHSKKRKVLSS